MPPREARIFRLGHHLVAFLDVLGRRDKFRRLKIPKTTEEEAQTKKVLQHTAGFVLELRQLFRRQFEVFESGLTALRGYTQAPLQPEFVGFSDSFVTSVALRNTEGGDLARVAIVSSALSAAAIVMLTSLAKKHPLRGGIDVGLATEIGPGEIYGTALEQAYVLESRIAEYPRIVIGNGLWNYLTSALKEFESQKSGLGRAVAAVVQRIMRQIAVDVDGNRILDYLGEIMVENSGSDEATHMVKPAYEFVLAEQNRVLVEADQKMIERYAHLRNYFETRLPLWGLEPRHQ